MSDSRTAKGPGLLRSSALVAALLVSPSVAQADPSGTTALDVETFLASFEAENPRFDLLAADVDRAEADLEAAGALPEVGLAYERQEVFPDGGGVAENTLRISWSLDFSGRRGRRVSAARHRVAAARSRGERARFVTIVEALKIYYAAARLRLRAAALREGRAPLARIVEALQKRVRAGDAAGYSLARLELELARYDERIAEAETALEFSRRSIGTLLGDASAKYEPTDPLGMPSSPGSIAELARDAVTERADHRAAVAEARSGQSLMDAAARWWVPVVDVSLGLKTADLGTETATGYVGGFSLRIPLFSRGRAEAKRGAAHRRSALARMRILEREVPARLRAAYELLENRIDRARLFETRQVAVVGAIVKKAESIYNAGEGSVVELLDAYRIAVEVPLSYIDLRWRARLAELELSRALGRRLRPAGDSK